MPAGVSLFLLWAAGRVLRYSPWPHNQVAQAAGRGFCCRPARAATPWYASAGAAASPPAACGPAYAFLKFQIPYPSR